VADTEGSDEAPKSTSAGYVMTAEEEKRRRQRNLAIAGAVILWVVLIFVVTLVRLGGSVAERSF